MSEAAVIFMVLIYNFTLMAGTAYMVAVYEWSPWWFLFTAMIMLNINKKE